MKRVGAAVVLVLALASCGGREIRTAAGTSAVATKAPGAQRSAQASPAQEQRGTATSSASPKANASPSPAASVSTSFPLQVTVSPSCGPRGSLMRAVIQTRKTAALAFAVMYSDGETHGNFGTSNADDAGRFVWSWIVSPDAPEGAAKLLIAAGDYTAKGEGATTTGEGDKRTIPFRVSSSC